MTTFKQFNFEANTINEEERSIIIYGSTNSKDRKGDIIEPTAFKLDKIQTLPILFNHEPNQAIGKTLWAKITDKGLQLKIYISDKTQLAKDVWELVKEGIISFASVGFIIEDAENLEDGGRLFRSVDLFETSLTPTPMNSGAIAMALKSINSPELKNMFEKELMRTELDERIKAIEEKLLPLEELSDKHNQLNEYVKQIELKETERENQFKRILEIEKSKKIKELSKIINSVKMEIKDI